MCGIYGIIAPGPSDPSVENRLARMGKILRHRGPDDQKNWVHSFAGKTIGLGFVRLSILDLETGMQPICCDVDNTAILCNGQIYNYIELRDQLKGAPFISRGDSEVALHLYRSKGLGFLSCLNGMYAGAIFDPGRRRLLLFRDRFGIKPLYYVKNNNTFFFSSEIKPLLTAAGIRPELNRPCLAAYFTYRYVPGNETMFKGVLRVPPGAYLDYDLTTGDYQIKRYWDYQFDSLSPEMSLESAVNRYYELFADAVKLRLRSDVEVAALISGGIDSSAVAAQAVRHQSRLRLFSIGFDEEKYNELDHVRNFLSSHEKFCSTELTTSICARKHLSRLPEIVRSLEEPVSLGTLLPTDMVCEMAAKQVKVVLTGEGADEIFGGYRKFMIERAASQFPFLSGQKQKTLHLVFPELDAYLRHRHHDPAKRYIQNEALFSADEIFQLTGQRFPEKLFSDDVMPDLSGNEDPVNQAIAYEARFRLPDYVILRLDRLSMRHSIEARTPFLDYRLAEFAATLPVGFKLDLETVREKFICGYAYQKFNVLDPETAGRRKQPFTIPLADWLASPRELPEYLQDILLGDVVRRQGILDPEFVRRLSGKITPQDIGPETLVSAADQVFAVIIITLWYQAFFSDAMDLGSFDHE